MLGRESGCLIQRCAESDNLWGDVSFDLNKVDRDNFWMEGMYITVQTVYPPGSMQSMQVKEERCLCTWNDLLDS